MRIKSRPDRNVESKSQQNKDESELTTKDSIRIRTDSPWQRTNSEAIVADQILELIGCSPTPSHESKEVVGKVPHDHTHLNTTEVEG